MADGKTPEIDMGVLLKPISALLPSGESLRRSYVYDQIKEARRADDPTLSQGIWQTSLKRADWHKVIDLCLDALENKSKDLRVAAWLTEAWLAKFGAPGCTQGFRLIENLIGNFWDTLHPPIEDGDLDGRLAPLGWVDQKLALSLKEIPLTVPATGEQEPLDWNHWERASVLERGGQRGVSEDDVTTAQFMTAVLLTNASFYRKLASDLDELQEAAVALDAMIDKRSGEGMASLRVFRATLKSIGDFVHRALNQKAEEEPEVEEDARVVGDDIDPGDSKVRWGAIRSRAEAYQRLAEAAQYLMRKEPHSPTPHLVRRAVSWGNMSFTELIQELVQDRGDLQSIYSLLGMNMPGD